MAAMERYGAIGKGDKNKNYIENTDKDASLSQNGDTKKPKKSWGNIMEKVSKMTNLPFSVFFIVVTEFCEKFSYFGMRTILVMYLTKWLLFNEDTATGLFHAFAFLTFFSPLPSAIIADTCLGKYKTSVVMCVIYGIGYIIMALTSFPPPEWPGPVIGLIFIGVGTGGIMTCACAFAGDQLDKGQEKDVQTLYSVFYFINSLGTLTSIFTLPLLRADVNCFRNSCYPLAFGIPALMMLGGFSMFLYGSRRYKKYPPTGNLMGSIFRCAVCALKHKITSKDVHMEKNHHWLDYAKDEFEPGFVEDVKTLCNLIVVCLPCPLFFALYEQQGSRWTLQAEKLDGDLGFLGTLKPEMLQVVNPFMLLLLIPFFQRVVYPVLDKCHIPNRPLQRMSAGMVFAVIAFTLAGTIQIKLDTEMEKPLSSSESGVVLVNTLPCGVGINSSIFPHFLHSESSSAHVRHQKGNFTIEVNPECQSLAQLVSNTELMGGLTYRILITEKSNHLQISKFQDNRKKPAKGLALISIFLATPSNIDAIKLHSSGTDKKKEENILLNVTSQIPSDFKLLDPKSYSVFVKDKMSNWTSTNITIDINMGEAKTAVFLQQNSKWHNFDVQSVSKNTLSMLVLLPQFILITIAEVLFSITGLAFAYSQAPNSMKSLVQAMFLMTASFGNLLVVIVAGIEIIPSQTFEFFLFAALAGIDTVLFMIISVFYKYNNTTSTEMSINDDTAGLVDKQSDRIPLEES